MKAFFSQLDYFVDLQYSPTESQFGAWENLLDMGLRCAGQSFPRLCNIRKITYTPWKVHNDSSKGVVGSKFWLA